MKKGSKVCIYVNLTRQKKTNNALVVSSAYSDIPCSEDGQEGPGEEILSTHRICDLELSFLSLSHSQAFVSSLLLSPN